ncbi:MAG: hypothetical protein P8R54_03865 [Myxococcota bacterium]|nr:hypothetical protein [Myxococcota bacterium]
MLLLSIFLACPKRPLAAAPAVDEIFEASIEAAGGREAMLSHHNVISRGQVNAPGAQMRLTVYHAAPDTLYTTLEIPQLGVVSAGYSDGVAWEFNPIMGPRLLTGDEAVEEARRADFYATLNYTAHYPQRTLIGRAKFAGTETWEVSVQTALGDRETLYFDIDSGLLKGSQVLRRIESGALASTTTFSEHRRVGGILLPAVMIQESAGVEVIVTLDEIHYDVESMPSLAPPPVVLELVSQEGL